MDYDQVTYIFCLADDFCKEFNNHRQANLLPLSSDMKGSGRRGPTCCLSEGEIMTILIVFQNIGYRNFKNFYINFLARYWKHLFPKLPSYNRFIEIMPRVTAQLTLFAYTHSGKRTNIYYIDSTCLPTCHIKRSKQHKTFKEVANYGKTSMGWFFGLKLHLVINDRGELMAFKITAGNKSDVKSAESLLSVLEGVAFGDKGYISKKLFENLLRQGLKLITRVRKNMEAPPLTSLEKQLLDQRNMVETVIGHLKHHYHVWHTRHRSVINAIAHLMASLVAYIIEPLKMSALKALSSFDLLAKTPN